MVGPKPAMEALVTAGEIVMPLSRKHHARVHPVDSEHSAIFQCLEGREPADVKRVEKLL